MPPPFKLLYVIAALLVFLVLFFMPEPDMDAALIAKLQAARPLLRAQTAMQYCVNCRQPMRR